MPSKVLPSALGASAPRKETQATRIVAAHLLAASQPVWGSKHQPLPHGLLALHDLGWAAKGAATPSVMLQIKTGGVHQEDQSVLEFLNDVLFSAYDASKGKASGADFYCAAIVHPGKKNRKFWPELAKVVGAWSVCLNPSTAKVQRGASPKTWIDATNKEISPYTRTQYAQIFSGTQKAKYVSLFSRPGKLTIPVDAQVILATGPIVFDLLVWKVGSPTLTGTKIPLDEWMP